MTPGDEARALGVLSSDPGVAYAERNALMPAARASCAHNPYCLIPNDPYFSQQWGLANDTFTVEPSAGAVFGSDIDAAAAWRYARSDRSVKIAIIDSGIDENHPDLAGKVVDNATLVSNSGNTTDYAGHGTAVAGVAAAIPNNGIGIAGSGYNASLMNIKTTDDSGTPGAITVSAVANAITYAADHGANIINISYGGYVYSQTQQDAINYAWNRGVLLVASAGNDNTTAPTYPAGDTNVIAVAATDNADQRASFSNADARWVELAAPGVGIVTTAPDYQTPMGAQGYVVVSGTSFSAPLVAGVAALLWPITSDANGDGYINDDVAKRLFTYADSIPGTGTLWSQGRVNACRAVTQDSSSCPNAPPPPRPTLPYMTGSDAKSYVGQSLTTRFGNAFRHRHRYAVSCSRDTRTQVRCGISWLQGVYYYAGNVVVYYGIQNRTLYWFYRLDVKRVSAACNSARPRRHCSARVFH